MKKNYYLIMLLLAVVMGSCKKEGSNTTSTDSETKSSSFYKVGTVLKFSDSNLVRSDGSKISYITRIPQFYNPSNANGQGGGALGNYTKANFEIARSNGGMYSIFFQGDGNIVLYKRSSPNGPVIYDALWASNALDSSTAGIAQFQDDGNIICKTANNIIYWSANINGGPNPIWILQDDGNFVGYSNVTQSSNGFIIQGGAFGATFTDGGQKSKHFGTMKRTN